MRIIIAEDDNVSRLILEAELQRLGHKVSAASDGQEAWELFVLLGADVVISDGAMPRVDGFDLCRRIRNSPASTYPYFIFITNLGDEASVRKGMDAGADDYLAKPLNAAELSARLVVASRINLLYRRMQLQQRELELLNRTLFSQARTDPLTGLINRLGLNEDATLFAERVEAGEQFCAIMCDIDYFKGYNDGYGHQAGDEVLRNVAASLRSSCRPDDRVYRFGGEEFLIVARIATAADGADFAERCRASVQGMRLTHAYSPYGIVTLSVGIAVSSRTSQDSVEAWLRRADESLYKSKELGRNRVTFKAAA